jgi:hypothetical protein
MGKRSKPSSGGPTDNINNHGICRRDFPFPFGEESLDALHSITEADDARINFSVFGKFDLSNYP